MSLIDQVKSAQDESFDKWFDRWYKSLNLESKIVQSAQQGYTGHRLSIKKRYDSESDWDKEEKYIARRMRDKRTVENIREQLGEGFDVEYVYDSKEVTLFGRYTTTRTEDYIRINWKE